MMTRVLRTAVLAVLGVAAAVAPASAAGFGIFEQGTRAMGMAGAFTAQADDPSALWHNAGGLAFFDETDFAAGFTYIMSSEADFRGADPFPGTSASAGSAGVAAARSPAARPSSSGCAATRASPARSAPSPQPWSA